MSRERGFKAARKHIEGKEKFIASCQSCFFMEDYCTNNNVTSFDIVEGENNRYCSYWRGFSDKKSKKKEEE